MGGAGAEVTNKTVTIATKIEVRLDAAATAALIALARGARGAQETARIAEVIREVLLEDEKDCAEVGVSGGGGASGAAVTTLAFKGVVRAVDLLRGAERDDVRLVFLAAQEAAGGLEEAETDFDFLTLEATELGESRGPIASLTGGLSSLFDLSGLISGERGGGGRVRLRVQPRLQSRFAAVAPVPMGVF